MDINTHSTLKTGLVGYWTLDSNANDSFGSHHGTLENAPTNLVAKLRTGYSLARASSQAISVPNHTDFNVQNFSLSLWFKPNTSNPAYTYTMIAKRNVAANRHAFILEHFGGTRLSFRVWPGGTGYQAYFDTTLDGTWSHVVATCAVNSQLKIYLNGVSVATQSLPAGAINTIIDDLTFGRISGATDPNYFDGVMDEPAMWNRVLTQDEITDLYQGGIGITWDGTFTSILTHPTLRSGLISHYKLDGNANDALGNYNGTLTGNTVPGKLGQCIANTGSNNQYVTLPSGLNPTPYVSVALWAKRSVLSDWGYPYQKGDTTSIIFINNGTVQWRIQSSTGVTQFALPSNDLNWHLYVGTFDGTNSKFCIDGAAFTSNARTGTVSSSEAPYITRNYSQCSADSVSIWNRPLAQSEVTDLYNSGIGLKYDAADLDTLEFYSAQSGDWSNPATWGLISGYPMAGSVAQINTGHTVQIDGNHTVGHAPNDSAYVMTIYGTLKWKIQAATDWIFKCRGSIRLLGGGLLQVGSEAEPIPSTQKATFRFEKSTSTATTWYLTACAITSYADPSKYGSVSVFGCPSYHMASASMQRTTLAVGVTSGSDKTIIFTDDVDYNVGDTIWIGYAGDPSIDPFNGTAINALYGSDTVTIKTKIDARTYTVDLTYTHVVGDFVIHKTRNVTFGGEAGVSLTVLPYIYIYTNINDGNGPYLDKWNGTINVQWAYLEKMEMLYLFESGSGLSDARIPTYKNCIVQAPNYLIRGAPSTHWPWLDETVPHLDELHVFGIASNVYYNNYALGGGTQHWGHVSLVDIAFNSGYTPLISTDNQDGRAPQELDIDSLWISWSRSISFNSYAHIISWFSPVKIFSMRARAIPNGLRFRRGSAQEESDVFLNDCQIQHVYHYVFYQGTVSGGTKHQDINCVSCKFANIKTGFAYQPQSTDFLLLINGSFNNCDFDNIAGEFIFYYFDGNNIAFEINHKFVNCRIGMMTQNANLIHLYDAWFRAGGRILFENCQIRKPANITASGTWTGIKGYCIRIDTNSFPGYTPANKIYRQLMPPSITYEWVNCQIYDDNGIDQFAVEYPNTKHLAIVGGGGELHSESAVIIDGSFAVKMLPYAVHGPHSGTRSNPIRIPLMKGEDFTTKISLRKNYSLPSGKRPTFNARGCGIDTSTEMTDVINTWEELTITGTALYEDTLEIWVTGGWNLYAGTSDDFWEPMALGTIVSYADKFSFSKTAPAAPKVLSASSLALNRLRINFDRPLRVIDAMYTSGASFSGTSLMTGLIAHYKFNSDLNDSGPNALNLTAVNGPMVYQEAKVENGLAMNASRYAYSNANALWNPTYISIFGWVRKDETYNDRRLVQKPRSGDHVHYGLGWNGDSIYGIINTDGGGGSNYSQSVPGNTYNWCLIGMTFDGSYVKIWLNGRCVRAAAHSGTLISTANNVYFGAYHNGGLAWLGMIDDLCIHNRALTETEIELLYSAGYGLKYTSTDSSIYSISGGKTPVIIYPRDRESVDILIDSDMTPGGSYTAGLIASSGIVDAYGTPIDESNRTASFTCHSSISTHQTLMECLCGAWLLDGNANDSSGNGYHGTIGGTPTFVSGKIGQGLNFAAGASNTVWINPAYLDRKKLNCITNFSVSCWAKFNSLVANAHVLVSKYCTESKTNTEQEHWLLYKTSGHVLTFEMPGASIAGPTATTNWVHLVIGYDGRTMVFYVNGALYGTATNVQPRHKPTYPLIPIRIGSCGVDADPPYPIGDIACVADAILDQVLHFNRLLTNDEVKAIYNAGNGLVF